MHFSLGVIIKKVHAECNLTDVNLECCSAYCVYFANISYFGESPKINLASLSVLKAQIIVIKKEKKNDRLTYLLQKLVGYVCRQMNTVSYFTPGFEASQQ